MSAQGRDLADAGMQMALFVKPDWKVRAESVIQQLAAAGTPFTADDVIERVGLPTRYQGMNANNAVGAVISVAARRKQIVRVGFTKQVNGVLTDIWSKLAGADSAKVES